jgi:hypothetical protein
MDLMHLSSKDFLVSLHLRDSEKRTTTNVVPDAVAFVLLELDDKLLG